MAATSIPKSLTLVSSDGESFEVAEEVAVQSITIKNMVEDGCSDDPIPLPNLDARILSQVIVYLKIHAGGGDEKEKKAKEEEFLKVENYNVLFEYILAANYLNIRSLTDLIAQKIADRIEHYSPERVRKLFGIKNDYTPEEEEKVKNENLWAFDDIRDD